MANETRVIETHPVQGRGANGCAVDGKRCPKVVTMAAYEVYCHVYGPQKEMVTGNCRGGFSEAELIAFLYARSFPKDQWRDRVDEAFEGEVNL